MLKPDENKAQAATELAVFGAILIFLLGTIVRTAVSNSYTQNQNFKAMRMAMLASWNDSKANPGWQQPQVTAHNSASVLFIEDRLSPDYSKYGDTDRNPYTSSGSGTFSYNLFYPLADSTDDINALPVMDVYINGQHFPFTMASLVPDMPITAPACSGTPNYTPPFSQAQCLQNQCLRNQREWAGGSGGVVQESTFYTDSIASLSPISTSCSTLPTDAAQRECQESTNACTIFTDLVQAQVIDPTTVSGQCPNPLNDSAFYAPPTASSMQGLLNRSFTPATSMDNSSQWATFVTAYNAAFSSNSTTQNTQYLNAILQMLKSDLGGYKLFYSLVPNPGGNGNSSIPWALTAPSCSSPQSSACKDLALSQTLTQKDSSTNLPYTNSDGAMEYDLLRNGNYEAVDKQFPLGGVARQTIAWQWAATAGSSAEMIGLDITNNTYPSYDIDGRLKEVTIYNIWQDSGGIVHVMYEDPDGGDIDSAWDDNSCGPKPGLQEDAQIFTFTKNAANATGNGPGTYLEIKEGKIYNPETGQYVRSANKRDTIDLIQRIVQMSNNTYRFCDANNDNPPPACIAGTGGTGEPACVPNPVEVCVSESSATDNCFQSSTIAQTCYDTNPGVNRIFVRSRLEDRRGHFWMTNTSGQLQVQR